MWLCNSSHCQFSSDTQCTQLDGIFPYSFCICALLVCAYLIPSCTEVLHSFYHCMCQAVWDFEGIWATSRHIPGVRFAGITHPGIVGKWDPRMWNV